jgi:hypothetical protein
MQHFATRLSQAATLLFVLLAAQNGRAQESAAIEKLIQREGKLCFARIYDTDHLKAHPRQKVERIFFMIGKDKASTYWEDPNLRHSEASPHKHANPDADDAERDMTQAGALITLRGAQNPAQVSGWCNPENPGSPGKKLRCGRECDRQIASIYSDDGAHLILDDMEPEVLLDPEVEEAGDRTRALGADDKKFRLEARPLADCVAEANKTNSPYANLGAPLRERLKADAPFCYGRDYASQHLATHLQQVTASIRVSRDAQQIGADRAKNLLVDWPDGAGLSVSVTTKTGSKPVRLRYVCTPSGDQWECSAAFCNSGAGDCSPDEMENAKATGCRDEESRTIYLRRGQKEFVMLGNPIGGLPLDGACKQKGKTTSDDKIFRLESMPLSACENR